MLKLRFLVTSAAVTLLISAVASVSAQNAQEGLSMGPSARPFKSPGNPLDHNFFDYDAQLWAPWDVTSVDGHYHPNTGFYAAFDYSYQSVSRPKPVPGADPRQFSSGNTNHWGQTFQFGFMGDNGAGFGIKWLNIEGSTFVFGEDVLVAQPELLNLRYNDLEINRVFRQPLSTGGYIEPYFGAKFLGINDHTIEDGLIGASSIRFIQNVENSAVGGHVGSRYVKRYGRWNVSCEGDVGATYNSQKYFASDLITTAGTLAINQLTLTSNDFVPYLDLGVHLSFNITRDVSIRGGAEFHWLWEGIARADIRTAPANPFSIIGPGAFPTSINSSDMIATGFSFGIDWKR